MREELERLNKDLAARDFPHLEVGIGLHHGPVVAAVVGSDEMTATYFGTGIMF